MLEIILNNDILIDGMIEGREATKIQFIVGAGWLRVLQ